MMDDQQTRRINEAAQKFAEALTESYRTAAERSVSVTQLNAELTQSFFNGVIENLRAQTQSNQELARELADLQRRQQEATQALAQESVDAYIGFVNSIFSYYGGREGAVAAPETGPESRGEGMVAAPEAVPEADPESRADDELPLEDYDSLNVRKVSDRLGELSAEEIERLRDYEARNKNRRTLMDRFNARLEAGSSS